MCNLPELLDSRFRAGPRRKKTCAGFEDAEPSSGSGQSTSPGISRSEIQRCAFFVLTASNHLPPTYRPGPRHAIDIRGAAIDELGDFPYNQGRWNTRKEAVMTTWKNE